MVKLPTRNSITKQLASVVNARSATIVNIEPRGLIRGDSRRGSGRVASLWIEREVDYEFVEPDDWTLTLAVFPKRMIPSWARRLSSSWTFFTYVCDEYEEIPNPSNANVMYTLVEDSSNETDLVQVGFEEGPGAVWNVDGTVEFLTKLFILGPYALFLVYQGWPRSSRQPTHFSMGYNAGLATIVYVYPYFLLFTDISLASWHLPALAVITWAVILVESVRGWWKFA